MAGIESRKSSSGEEGVVDDLSRQGRFFITVIGTALMEGVFVTIWWVVQWAVGKHIVDRLPLSRLDSATAYAFQVILAITTVLPILIFAYQDIATAYYRARARVAEEKAKWRHE